MPSSCCAVGCSNASANKETNKAKGISFFHFPLKDKQLVRKWLLKLRSVNFQPNENTTICSDHFTEDDFVYQPFTNRKGLKLGAFPTKFSFASIDKVRQKRIKSSGKKKQIEINLGTSSNEESDVDDPAKTSEMSEEEPESSSEIGMDENTYSSEQIGMHTGNSQTVQDSTNDIEDTTDMRIAIMKDKLESKIVLRTLKKNMLEAEIKVAHSKKNYFEAKTSSVLQTNKVKTYKEPLSGKDLETYTSLKTRLMEEELAAQIEEKVLQQQLLEAEIRAANSKKSFYETKKATLLLFSNDI